MQSLADESFMAPLPTDAVEFSEYVCPPNSYLSEVGCQKNRKFSSLPEAHQISQFRCAMVVATSELSGDTSVNHRSGEGNK